MPAMAVTTRYVRVDGSDMPAASGGCDGTANDPQTPGDTTCAYKTVNFCESQVGCDSICRVAAGDYIEPARIAVDNRCCNTPGACATPKIIQGEGNGTTRLLLGISGEVLGCTLLPNGTLSNDGRVYTCPVPGGVSASLTSAPSQTSPPMLIQWTDAGFYLRDDNGVTAEWEAKGTMTGFVALTNVQNVRTASIATGNLGAAPFEDLAGDNVRGMAGYDVTTDRYWVRPLNDSEPLGGTVRLFAVTTLTHSTASLFLDASSGFQLKNLMLLGAKTTTIRVNGTRTNHALNNTISNVSVYGVGGSALHVEGACDTTEPCGGANDLYKNTGGTIEYTTVTDVKLLNGYRRTTNHGCSGYSGLRFCEGSTGQAGTDYIGSQNLVHTAHNSTFTNVVDFAAREGSMPSGRYNTIVNHTTEFHHNHGGKMDGYLADSTIDRWFVYNAQECIFGNACLHNVRINRMTCMENVWLHGNSTNEWVDKCRDGINGPYNFDIRNSTLGNATWNRYYKDDGNTPTPADTSDDFYSPSDPRGGPDPDEPLTRGHDWDYNAYLGSVLVPGDNLVKYSDSGLFETGPPGNTHADALFEPTLADWQVWGTVPFNGETDPCTNCTNDPHSIVGTYTDMFTAPVIKDSSFPITYNFAPKVDSPLIDAGDPDIDLDGFLERQACQMDEDRPCRDAADCAGLTPDTCMTKACTDDDDEPCAVNGDCATGTCSATDICDGTGDDCCTYANHCAGLTIDIGAIESGLIILPPRKPVIRRIQSNFPTGTEASLTISVGDLPLEDQIKSDDPPTFLGTVKFMVDPGSHACFVDEAAWTAGTTVGTWVPVDCEEKVFTVTGLSASTDYCIGARIARSDSASNVTALSADMQTLETTLALTGEIDCSVEANLVDAIADTCDGSRDTDTNNATEPIRCANVNDELVYDGGLSIPATCEKAATPVVITLDLAGNTFIPNGVATFLTINSPDHVIQHATLQDWDVGIRNATGVYNLTIDDIMCISGAICFKNDSGAGPLNADSGNEYTNITIGNAVTGFSLAGIPTTTANHNESDVLISATSIIGATTGIDITGPMRASIDGVTMEIGTTGVAIDATTTMVDLANVTITGTEIGVTVDGGAHVYLDSNNIVRNNTTGVYITGADTRVVAQSNIIDNNPVGITVADDIVTPPCLGDCAINLDFTAAIPTGTSRDSDGYNSFIGDWDPRLLRGPIDLVNDGAVVTATRNCWGVADKMPNPRVAGEATTEPLLAACGGPAGGGVSPISSTKRIHLDALDYNGTVVIFADAGTTGDDACAALAIPRVCTSSAKANNFATSALCDASTDSRVVACGAPIP